jgi:hypothetical protein
MSARLLTRLPLPSRSDEVVHRFNRAVYIFGLDITLSLSLSLSLSLFPPTNSNNVNM